MPMQPLVDFARSGFAAVPPARFEEVAAECVAEAGRSGDARFAIVGEMLGDLGTWWKARGGVPTPLANEIEAKLRESLPVVLDEQLAPQDASREAVELRASIHELQLPGSAGPERGVAAASASPARSANGGSAEHAPRQSDEPPDNTAVEAARVLVQTDSISFRTEPFFRLTSGAESPIYVDNRRLLGHPVERNFLVSKLVAAMQRDHAAGVAAVAGTSTAGIPWAAWIADRLDLPMLYVRSEAKQWGHERAVEGTAPAGSQVILIEDLLFTAGSLATSVRRLRAGGFEVDRALTILTYRTPAALERTRASKVSATALTTIDCALAVAVDLGLLTPDQVLIVEQWLVDLRGGTAS